MKRYIQVILLTAILGSCTEPKVKLRAPLTESAGQPATKDSMKVDSVKTNPIKKN